MASRKVSRRAVVTALGGGVLVAPAAGALSGLVGTAGREPGDASRLLDPLTAGSPLARWTVVEVEALRHGALGVLIEAEGGQRFRLEVLRRDASPAAPRPPASTELFAVHVCNGGHGWSPTVEDQGLAAMTLATVIARNEGAASTEGFLTLAERITQHRGHLLG
jgi:hypothetical protein